MKVREISKKLVKSSWGIIVAFGVIIGIFATYYQLSEKVSILSQIVNQVNVLDVHDPLNGLNLKILFGGEDIQEGNLNLRIYTVKISNNGSINILQSYFDQNSTWGIKVENANKIISFRLVDSNSDYIKANLSPQLQGDKTLAFNKIILDQGDFFTLELLVLHDKKAPPVLYRIGEIAGIQQNESEILAQEHKESLWWANIFSGGWIVNVIRFIVYGLIALVIFFVVAVAIIKWHENRKKLAQSPQPPQQPN